MALPEVSIGLFQLCRLEVGLDFRYDAIAGSIHRRTEAEASFPYRNIVHATS